MFESCYATNINQFYYLNLLINYIINIIVDININSTYTYILLEN